MTHSWRNHFSLVVTFLSVLLLASSCDWNIEYISGPSSSGVETFVVGEIVMISATCTNDNKTDPEKLSWTFDGEVIAANPNSPGPQYSLGGDCIVSVVQMPNHQNLVVKCIDIGGHTVEMDCDDSSDDPLHIEFYVGECLDDYDCSNNNNADGQETCSPQNECTPSPPVCTSSSLTFCNSLVPPSCDGEWSCQGGECNWDCTSGYPVCSSPEDCSGLSHSNCPGAWECLLNECSWRCKEKSFECLNSDDCQSGLFPRLSDHC